MTDIPILFSAQMVRALLDGRKTQTRRVLRVQPKVLKNGIWYRPYPVLHPLHFSYLHGDRVSGFADVPCAPGDSLWVREAHALVPSSAYRMSEGVAQVIDPSDRDYACVYREGWDRSAPRWRPSIHMPRWASRLTLIVTDVRVQRLQEISAEDSIAEGVRCETCEVMNQSACHGLGCFASIYAFRDLWNSLHGPEAWAANPWVSTITFRTIRANIDSAEAAA